MALAFIGFELHVTLADKGGNTANLSYMMDSADYAALATEAGAVRAALADVTDAAIKGYSLVSRYLDTAFALPIIGEVEARATVVGQIAANPLKKATIHIPAPKDALFVGAPGTTQYNQVDGTNADLLTYLEIWQSVGGVANISDGEYLDATSPFDTGKRTHRHSSRG